LAGWQLIAVSLWATTTVEHPLLRRAQDGVAQDSQQVLEDARSAQVQFERTRRRYLPWGHSSYGRCDVRIGRYCLTGIDWGDRDDQVNTDEHPAIGAARAELIARLDSAAGSLPGDGWIAGQRVRYLVEAGDVDEAVRVASACSGPEPWWCRALAGFVHYAARDFAHSEAAYGEALRLMDEVDRCEWEDLSRILDGAIRNRYRDLSCAERAPLQRRILWLADPFHSIPGNELLAEHYSRQVHSVLLEDAESPEGDRWAADLHRIVLRYGWSYGWERVRTNSRSELRPPIRGHLAHGAKYFLPTAAAVDHPTDADSTDWDLEPHLPRAGHVPPYASAAFDFLTHQLAAFRRGDSLLVVTTFELTHDSIPEDGDVRAALVFTRDETAAPHMARRVFPTKRGTLTAMIPSQPHLMSYEVLAVKPKRAARARYGIDPARLFASARPDGDGAPDAEAPNPISGTEITPALSGILVTNIRDSLPETLHAAIASARSNTRMHPGERIGLYWELYGTGPAVQHVATSLTLTKRGKSFLKRLGGVFGLGSDEPPVSLEWIDAPSPLHNTYPRAVAVDLPDDLPNGTYELLLRARLENGRRMELVKRIEVRQR
jgi:hypothetical protein